MTDYGLDVVPADSSDAKGRGLPSVRTVVDLKTGDLVHSVTVGGIVEDIYDILMLPGVQRPIALGSKTDDTRRVISI